MRWDDDESADRPESSMILLASPAFLNSGHVIAALSEFVVSIIAR